MITGFRPDTDQITKMRELRKEAKKGKDPFARILVAAWDGLGVKLSEEDCVLLVAEEAIYSKAWEALIEGGAKDEAGDDGEGAAG